MVSSPKLRTIPTNLISTSDLGLKLPLPRTCEVFLKPTSTRDPKRIFSALTTEHELIYINKTIEELHKIDGIELVVPVFQVPGDNHSVVFQIKLLNSINPTEEDSDLKPQPEKIEQILEIARKLVLEKCRDIRKITDEKWYFSTELFSDCSD